MNIFDVILSNFSKRSRTRKTDDRVDCQGGFRGELVHQASLCTLCGSCTYVCSPGAITRDLGNESGAWKYDQGRCTFCGKCAEYCPTGALSFLQQPAAVLDIRAAEHVDHAVAYQHCKRCGASIIPLPVETLVRLYRSEEAAQHALEVHELCERCRGRVHSQHFKVGLTGVDR